MLWNAFPLKESLVRGKTAIVSAIYSRQDNATAEAWVRSILLVMNLLILGVIFHALKAYTVEFIFWQYFSDHFLSLMLDLKLFGLKIMHSSSARMVF